MEQYIAEMHPSHSSQIHSEIQIQTPQAIAIAIRARAAPAAAGSRCRTLLACCNQRTYATKIGLFQDAVFYFHAQNMNASVRRQLK